VKFVGRRYLSRFTFAREEICLGYFDTAKEAAIAYNKAATKYLGSNARLNVIRDDDEEPIVPTAPAPKAPKKIKVINLDEP
jgi:hypothetical protein